MSAYAPHITEELWSLLGHTDSIVDAQFPVYDESYMQETDFTYPVSFNGKMRLKLNFPVTYTQRKLNQSYWKMLMYKNGWQVLLLRKSSSFRSVSSTL